jgi:hypothetical protein
MMFTEATHCTNFICCNVFFVLIKSLKTKKKKNVYRGKTPKTKSITRKLMAFLNHRYLREVDC